MSKDFCLEGERFIGLLRRPFSPPVMPANRCSRGPSLPRRGAPGICIVSFALLALLYEGSGAPKDAGVCGPRSRLRRPDTLAWRVWILLAIGDPRLSALHHGVFVKPSPTHLGPRLPAPGYWRFHPVVQQSSLHAGRSVRGAGSRGAPGV